MALDRWTKLQAAPFGTSSALRGDRGAAGGSSGSQFRRLTEDYNTAMRLLRRRARRGDAQSALGAIKLREDAISKGIQPGGIRRKEEFDAGILGRVQAMEQGAVDRERGAQANRQIVNDVLAEDAPATPGAPPAQATPAAPVDSRATAALDIYEGEATDNDSVMQRGLDMASRLGIRNPVSILDRVDKLTAARKTLDTALSQARTPAEIAALRERSTRFGVTPEAFDRRTSWWDRNRSL